MKITVFGSGREVGRSAILINSEKNLLLDCGIKVRDEENPTGFPKITSKVDFSIITHGHLDHCGYTPVVKDCIFFSTPPTLAILELLIKDAKKVDPSLPFGMRDIENLSKKFILIPYEIEQKVGDLKFILHDAGHIPGSSIVEINCKNKKIVYTGDFKLEETRLQHGGKLVEDVDVLIIESTYSYLDHKPRKKIEEETLKSTKEILDEGGNVIFPSFAVGRTQELELIFFNYDVELPVYSDGMGNDVSKIFLNYPPYIKNYLIYKQAISNVREVVDKKEPLNEPSVIVSTAGMCEGGPVINYILSLDKKIKEEKKPGKIIFTGFCVKETNGWYLQNIQTMYLKKSWKVKKRPVTIDIPIESHHLSAHAGKSEILKFIEKANPEKIICVHGEFCEDFAKELVEKGYDAVAPKNGDSIEIG
jgi:putative mRNA 3-end processing factor